MSKNKFLPISREDMQERRWHELDFLYISGEAYVDHPSFGVAVITRVLEAEGFKVGIIPQPDWKNIEAFKIMGRPKLGVMISSGTIDSMVNNYSVAKHKRSKDVYSPGGVAGRRPDRAVIVYANKIREAFGEIPIIIGGVEASLRRFAHYDYWDDKVRKSILVDSNADIISFGMGEKSIVQIANMLKYGEKVETIRDIRGIVYRTKTLEGLENYVEVPSFEEVSIDKKKYIEAFNIQYENQDAIRGKSIVQKHDSFYVVQTPPPLPLAQEELDRVHELPYMRTYHNSYEQHVPAIDEVQFSVIAQRGCFGNCSFCSIAFHQGRIIQPRSHESIIKECKAITDMPNFKGYIHDIGGATANFRKPSCKKQLKVGTCKNRQCLYPEPCPNLEVGHSDFVNLLRKVRSLPKIKKVFVRSGIRYDYVVYDKDKTFINELCKYHVSGQLKVAPEHICSDVLYYMGKPTEKVYNKFVQMYTDTNKKLGLKQYLVPYLMSSHPGSTIKSAIKLAEYIRDMGYTPEQVQDFYPTPGTLSTCMYYTGIDPRTGKKVYVPKDHKEKAMQRALLQYKNPNNYDLVYEALTKAGREDLIGYDKRCLIKPRRPANGFKSSWNDRNTDRNNRDRNRNSNNDRNNNDRNRKSGNEFSKNSNDRNRKSSNETGRNGYDRNNNSERNNKGKSGNARQGNASKGGNGLRNNRRGR